MHVALWRVMLTRRTTSRTSSSIRTRAYDDDAFAFAFAVCIAYDARLWGAAVECMYTLAVPQFN